MPNFCVRFESREQIPLMENRFKEVADKSVIYVHSMVVMSVIRLKINQYDFIALYSMLDDLENI